MYVYISGIIIQLSQHIFSPAAAAGIELDWHSKKVRTFRNIAGPAADCIV